MCPPLPPSLHWRGAGGQSESERPCGSREEAATWVLLPFSWDLTREPNPTGLNSPTIPNSDARLTVPFIQSPLQVGPIYYPEKAREMHLEGECTVHALIAKGGSPSETSITKSTGLASLDEAGILATQEAQILPKKDRGPQSMGRWISI